jgi:hypothetical protein
MDKQAYNNLYMIDWKSIKSKPKNALLTRIWTIFTIIIIIFMIFYSFFKFGQTSSVIFRISGDVTAFNPDSGVWETAKTGQSLSSDLRIKTGAKSWVEVRLDDGSLLRIGENTEVKVVTIYVNPMMGIRTARWSMQGKGTVYVNTGESGSIYDIITPNFTASAMSGIMRVDGDEKGNYEVKVPDESSKAIIDTGKITKSIQSGKVAKIDSENKMSVSDSISDEFDTWNQNLNNPDLEIKHENVTSQEDYTFIGFSNPGISIHVNNIKSATANSEGQFTFNTKLIMGKNIFEFTAIDNAGRETKKRVQIERAKPNEHQIIIVSPEDGSSTTEEKVTISGMAVGSDKLLVNNSNVILNKNHFTVVVPLEPGKNKIDIVSFDKNNARIEKSLLVSRGKSQSFALLTISSPKNSSEIKEGRVIIKGSTNGTRIIINSKTVVLTSGNFDHEVELEYGKNIFVVTASGDKLKDKSETLIIHRPKPNAISPKLKISSYPTLVNKRQAPISGEVTDAITLTINKKNITFAKADGYFSDSIPLSEGVNKIRIEAISADGGVTTQTIEIVCDVTPPDLSRLIAYRTKGKDGITVQGQFDKDTKRLIANNSIIPTTDITINSTGNHNSLFHVITSYKGNTIIVKAEDAAGNASERVIKIETAKNP